MNKITLTFHEAMQSKAAEAWPGARRRLGPLFE